MEFIKEYSTVIIAVLGAGGWLGFFVKLFLDSRKDKKDTIKGLQKELDAARAQNEELRSIEQKEKFIDKSNGSVYIQTVGEGKTRGICGYCWERGHITIPVIIETQWDEGTQETYYGGRCRNCKSFCQHLPDKAWSEISDDDLPF